MSAPSDSPCTAANEHARARAAAAWPEHQAGGGPPVNAAPTCADVVHAPPILPLPASAWSRHHHPFRAPLLPRSFCAMRSTTSPPNSREHCGERREAAMAPGSQKQKAAAWTRNGRGAPPAEAGLWALQPPELSDGAEGRRPPSPQEQGRACAWCGERKPEVCLREAHRGETGALARIKQCIRVHGLAQRHATGRPFDFLPQACAGTAVHLVVRVCSRCTAMRP